MISTVAIFFLLQADYDEILTCENKQQTAPKSGGAMPPTTRPGNNSEYGAGANPLSRPTPQLHFYAFTKSSHMHHALCIITLCTIALFTFH